MRLDLGAPVKRIRDMTYELQEFQRQEAHANDYESSFPFCLNIFVERWTGALQVQSRCRNT